MPLKDAIKISRKTFFNPRGWLGYDFVKAQTKYLWKNLAFVFGGFFHPEKAEVTETFEEALARMGLTEKSVQENQQIYFNFAIFFLLVGLVLMGLWVFYLAEKHYSASFISLSLGLVLLAHAFKYHFWYFQIKHRKLGCTFAEWLQGKPHA